MNFPTLNSFGFAVTTLETGGASATGPTLVGPTYPGGQPSGPQVSSRLRLRTAPITARIDRPVEFQPVAADVVRPTLDMDAGQVIRVVDVDEKAAQWTPSVEQVIKDVDEQGVRLREAEMEALRRASVVERDRLIEKIAEQRARELVAQAQAAAQPPATLPAPEEKKGTPWGWIAAAAAAALALKG